MNKPVPWKSAIERGIVSNAVVLMLKYPQPGKVKTRLACSVGKEKAAWLYKGVVDAMGRALASLRSGADGKISLLVAFDPPEKEAAIRSWLHWADGYFPQEGEGLGARLMHALYTALRGGAKRVILLGSDTLNLDGDILLEGFRLLESHDVVLGPARDGGYYAIGLKQAIGVPPYPPRTAGRGKVEQLFEEIPWSTSAVLETTKRKAESLGLSTQLLPLLSDLDE